jgi:hypothetical protein
MQTPNPITKNPKMHFTKANSHPNPGGPRLFPGLGVPPTLTVESRPFLNSTTGLVPSTRLASNPSASSPPCPPSRNRRASASRRRIRRSRARSTAICAAEMSASTWCRARSSRASSCSKDALNRARAEMEERWLMCVCAAVSASRRVVGEAEAMVLAGRGVKVEGAQEFASEVKEEGAEEEGAPEVEEEGAEVKSMGAGERSVVMRKVRDGGGCRCAGVVGFTVIGGLESAAAWVRMTAGGGAPIILLRRAELAEMRS